MTSEDANKIMETLGRLDERTLLIKEALPPIVVRVEKLEGAKNRLWGMGSLAVLLGSYLEWLFHRKP